MAWNDNFPPLNLWNYKNYMEKVCERCFHKTKPLGVACVCKWGEPVMNVNKTTSGVNEIQYGGNHYKTKAIQPWDYVIANNLGYLEGTIIKYITRYQDKNGVEDLQKARHFLDKLIEVKSIESK